ncbi:MAG: hexokinase [Candidatus Azobacteroides sp.]|nr:hexokinase [Candidatus Azobacteroides sp.]
MENNLLSLSTEQRAAIAKDLEKKLNIGLAEEEQEIRCLPTYIDPKEIKSGKSLVLDWGGTNFRAAIIEFYEDKAPVIIESVKAKLSAEETKGFKQVDLFKAMAAEIKKLKKLDKNIKKIGYCFSYPAESTLDGDAKLLHWTKGIEIDDMPGKMVGKPLLQYLNDNVENANFEKIAVINDTVACLFSGISKPGYNAYLGLIVGTGTNMATTMQAAKVKKMDKAYKGASILINTESGNFFPPFLTEIDDNVDAASNNKGKQRFEKAISGKYLSEIFKMMFPYDEFNTNDFHTGTLNDIVNYPDIYKEKYVDAARSLFDRSEKLVAASLAGLIFVLKSQTPDLKSVLLTAEGTLFWCKDRKGIDYNKAVLQELNRLLVEKGYSDVTVDICEVPDANLIGSAIAALSL